MDQNPTFGFFTVERDREYLHGTISLAESAVAHGNTPFGVLLAGPDGQVLMEQENVERTGHDCTGHAETALVRRASSRFSREFLAGCSLYTSVEPCAMCAGAIYWSGIGRVVFGMSERHLLELTGNDPRNPTMDLPCREVFARGQRTIVVVGPFSDLQAELEAVHQRYWGKREE